MTATAATTAASVATNAQTSDVTRSTGPIGMTDTPSPDSRLIAESAANDKARRTSAEDEAAKRVDDQRTREAKVARQTAMQSTATSTRMVSEMQRVASILSASHKTQVSMDNSLRNIDAYFQKLRKDEKEAERNEVVNDKGLLDDWFGGDKDETPGAALSFRRS